MKGLTKTTFSKLSMAHGDTEPTVTEWTGYIGGDIPAGLIVARLAQLGSHTEPSAAWTVYHQSGYVVNYRFGVSTRKVAIAFARNLAEVGDQIDLDWDVDRDTLMEWVNADHDRYRKFQDELLTEAARKATQS